MFGGMSSRYGKDKLARRQAKNGRHSMLFGGSMEGLLQPTHLIFIFGIILLIFGPKKLPDLGHGLGKGIREFKDAVRGAVEIKADGEK